MASDSINSATIHEWVINNLDIEGIKAKLASLGYDEQSITENIKEFKRIKYARRQTWGFIYLGTGAFLGFISCVLTLVNPVPELYNWILFGLTSISISIICLGLYKLFE